MRLDPRIALKEWTCGQFQIQSMGQHDALRICEEALANGHMDVIDEIGAHLTDCERELLNFRQMQIENNAEMSQEHLARALEMSRSSANRDHLLEGRIRMEWGVLRDSLGQSEQAGIDLRWSMDRLNALSEGHPWHGVACLNMAKWHENRGEWGMALAIYSGMSRHGPHMVENIAIARRRAAEIHIEIKQMMNALRNLWIAHHGFRESSMNHEALESGLHWLDIALSNVDVVHDRMESVVENAAPRSHMEPVPELKAHPDDVKDMYMWLDENLGSRKGKIRPDLHVLADAADLLGIQPDISDVEDMELQGRYRTDN